VVTKEGLTFEARTVVLTTGTFLRGAIHLGLDPQVPAGRAGESPAIEISQAIAAQGITRERFKTGTPPRIDGRTVDFSRLTRQDGDAGPYWFSQFERTEHPEQLPCFLTWAGAEVKEIIQRHLQESALYGGAISGRGPRYCPSVEDKVVRFPEAARHQVFLEPEGLGTAELYVNGLSTSLPANVQLAFLRAVPGLASVEMTRPGYAIEYDYFPPTQLYPTLESRALPGLFFAGQVNGTTGYEEAAGQGAIAGLNAALQVQEREPVVLSRDEAMTAVLVDDLVHRGVDEPYRLFTSRAEFRILLRQDNALRRLYPVARRLGLLDEAEIRTAEERLEGQETALREAAETAISPGTANPILAAAGESPIGEPTRLKELCRRPGVTLASLLSASGSTVNPEHAEWADIEIKYEGYLVRERDAATRLAELDEVPLPATLEYHSIQTISWEAREKLSAVQPTSIGQAGRVPGVSPADLQNLAFAVLRQRA
jgi:tRNA uridine 5-carboxymethylaminomethyl modification enzyme